jgi:chaperonin cofactor prefoldin
MKQLKDNLKKRYNALQKKFDSLERYAGQLEDLYKTMKQEIKDLIKKYGNK